MKKILLMLAMMLPCLGVWAETIELSLLSKFAGANWYTAEGSVANSGWTNKLVTNNTIPAITLQAPEGENVLGWYSKNSGRWPALQAGHVYTITVPEGYGFKGYALTTQATTVNNKDTFTYTTSEGQVESVIQQTSDSKVTVTGLDNIRTITIDLTDYNVSSTSGIAISGLDVTVEMLESNFITTLENWSNNYKFKVSGERGFIYATEGETPELKGTNVASTIYDETNDFHHFAIVKYNEKFYLYNIGAQKFVVRNGDNGQGQGVALSESPKHAIEITPATDLSTLYDWKMTLNGADMNLSNGGGHTYGIRCANGTEDGGTRWAFEKVSEYDATPILERYFYVNYILTDNAGNTYTANVEGTAGVAPAFTGVEGYTLENGSWNANTYTATINFPFEVSSATKPNLTYIGQGVWTGADKKWTVVNGNVQAVDDKIVDEIKEVLPLGPAHWLIYPTLNGTEFTFKIQSVSTSKYVTANSESGEDAEAKNQPITLTDNGTAFQFIHTGYSYTYEGETKNVNGFAYKNNEGTTLFITCKNEDDNNVHLGVCASSPTHYGSGVRFPIFNQFKVVIGSAGYTTLYAPFMALTNDMQNNPQNWIDENEVEIYTISDKATYNEATKQNMVHLTKMTSYIPQNGAAILKGSGTYVFTKLSQEMYEHYLYDAEVEAYWNANFLKGSSANTYVAEDAYVLSAPGGDENIGLYKAKLNKNANGGDGNSHFLNNAGKVYLPASLVETTAGALRFNFGGTTAIESVLNNNTDANAPIYDLSGRRVMNTVKGGIYIQNGKKFIVK